MEALVPTKGRGPLPCVDLREATERYGSSLPASQSSGTRGSAPQAQQHGERRGHAPGGVLARHDRISFTRACTAS